MSGKIKSLVVTIDGGGSTCRAIIYEWSGNVLGVARGGSANIATDFDRALENILDTTRSAYIAAGLPPERMTNDFAYLGLAGANLGGIAKRTQDALNFSDTTVTSDREITVQGAMGDGDGTVAAIGTGSFFVSRINNKTLSIGGWGFQLGDDDGGAFLGRKLLRQTILAYDGVTPHSPLTRTILDRFGGTPQGLVAFVQTATPMDYGAFSPALIEAYYQDDAVAKDILDAAVVSLHRTLDILNAKATGAIYMLGGLGPVYEKLLHPDYQALCVAPKGDPSAGALALAQRRWGRKA